MKKINVAVIGTGYWGPNIIRNLYEIKNVGDIYACDIANDRLLKVKKNFPKIICETDYGKILRNKTVDAVIIATPIKTHFKLAANALNAKKHVLVEKPITASSADAKKLIRIAKRNKKKLMAGHTFVYTETVKTIKKLLDSGTIGKVYYYDSTRINLGLIQNDSNVIWDLAPHDLSIISYLFPQNPISVQAFGSAFIGKHLEMAHIFIRFEKNISAHIHISWLSPVKIRTVLIGGSKKMIMYNDIEPSEKIKIYDKGILPSKSLVTPFAPAYRSGDVLIPHLDQKEALLSELTHFVDCIVKNKQPKTGGKEGLAVVNLLEKIDEAITTHREIKL